MSGIKFDAGKPRPDLVLGDFMIALEHPTFVGTFGATKYAPKNFHKLPNGEQRYGEAGMRHYVARKKAAILEDDSMLFDDESGELHIAHEIWDKIAELFFWLKENGHRRWELTIQNKDDPGLYFTPFEDEEWSGEPYWWEENAGRQAIWHLTSEGVRTFVHKREKTPEQWVVRRWYDGKMEYLVEDSLHQCWAPDLDLAKQYTEEEAREFVEKYPSASTSMIRVEEERRQTCKRS